MIRETIEEVVLQEGFLNGVMAGAKEIGLDLNTQRFTKLSDEIKEKRNKVMIPTMIKTIIGSIHKVEKTFKGMDKRLVLSCFTSVFILVQSLTCQWIISSYSVMQLRCPIWIVYYVISQCMMILSISIFLGFAYILRVNSNVSIYVEIILRFSIKVLRLLTRPLNCFYITYKNP